MNSHHFKAKALAFGLASVIALAPMAAQAQFGGRPVLPNPHDNPENSGGARNAKIRSGEGAPVLGQDRSGYTNKRMTSKRSKHRATAAAKRKTNATETTGTVSPKPMNSGTMNNGSMNSAPINAAPSSGSMPSTGTSGSSGPAKAAPTGDNAVTTNPQ